MRKQNEQVAGRGDDMHKWVNRELHGWWVGRGMEIAESLEELPSPCGGIGNERGGSENAAVVRTRRREEDDGTENAAIRKARRYQ